VYSSAAAARVKLAFDNNHQVASHTWRHVHLSQLSEPELQAEFCRDRMCAFMLQTAVPSFAKAIYATKKIISAFGEYNFLVLKVAGDRGQTLVN
ncbi:hypothetical protein BDZ89DRAFT_960571, partial [Hymenopellis radicata]